jgi:tRNA-specific 2-thiouridylase
MKEKKKILTALSGGVDSSVAAALLVREGYDVTGAYMKQISTSSIEPWSDSKEVRGVCSWKEDRRDALRVAAGLGIPLITLDFEKEYKEWVMRYMFDEYKVGRTPNPDVLCNKYVKFGFWLDKARELGFDCLATGHYARINEQRTKDHRSLLVARDAEKDQTYFLHQLSQEQLKHVLFPIGEYTKTEVRMLAKKFDLPTADRKESMGICFIGEVPMKEFLQQKIKPTPGNIVTSDGKVIGEHEGLAFYTIGQRHLGVHSSEFGVQRGETKALYVVEKKFETNELVVGFDDDPLLWKKEIVVQDVNWVSGQAPVFPLECTVRLRHRQELQKSEIRNQKSKVVVTFEESQKAVTPGQFAVFYLDGECLGGGVIQ